MSSPPCAMPPLDTVRAGLRGSLVEAETFLRDWSETGNRRAAAMVLRVLGGLALLARLYRQARLEAMTRQAVRLVRHSTAQGYRKGVNQSLRVLAAWDDRAAATDIALTHLAPLRDAVLDGLRRQQAGAAPADLVRRYLALRDMIVEPAGRQGRTDTAAGVCRAVLGESCGKEAVRQAPDAKLAEDVAFHLDRLLLTLDTGRECSTSCRHALYAAFRELSVLQAAVRLRCIRFPLPALRQGRWLLLLLLRHHPAGWPVGSMTVLLRQLLAVQYGLRALPSGRLPDLRPVMQDTGRFLRAWCSPEPRTGVAELIGAETVDQELGRDARTLFRTARDIEDNRPPAAASASLCKLRLNLHSLGLVALSWWADSLQHALLARLQSGTCRSPDWRSHLVRFRMRALPSQSRGAAMQDVSNALLDAVEEEARAMGLVAGGTVPEIAAPRAGVAESGVRRQRPVIDQLSGGMSLLPDPGEYFRRLLASDPGDERDELVGQLRTELSLLERGARLLAVRRIEALASVLGTVYGALCKEPEGGLCRAVTLERSVLLALQRGHAGLLYRLDQAAAWQTVSRPQPVIEFLYRFMERRQADPSRTGLAPRQRCLAINRRLQSLLQSVWVDTVARERRTLVLTLLRDQARLLREMSDAVDGAD